MQIVLYNFKKKVVFLTLIHKEKNDCCYSVLSTIGHISDSGFAAYPMFGNFPINNR